MGKFLKLRLILFNNAIFGILESNDRLEPKPVIPKPILDLLDTLKKG
jgi:hypothetical protein